MVDSWIMRGEPGVGGERHVPLLAGTRALLAVFGVLTALAVAALFVRPDTTDRYFAWTIQPPVTAAFLGAAYAAGCTLVVLCLRAPLWTQARGPFVTILVFTVLTLVATVVHRDRFHWDGPGPVALVAAWFWLAVYVAVPVLMVVVLLRQVRHPGGRPAQGHPEPRRLLPRWLAAVLLAQGAVMGVVGVTLFAGPGTFGAWPWALTPLTSRAVGAWLVAFGIAAALAVAEGDLARLRAPATAYLVFAVAELAVLLRYAGTPDWGTASPWVYAAFLGSVLAAAAAGLVLVRRAVPAAPVP